MPRSNQTKQLLAQSLQELMATAPLEKISVNDIVDHANVGRNTFYYHFEDKYDLVNWYFQSGITRFLVELSAYSSWNALLAALETYFLENKVFYCNALAYNGQNSLQQYMFDYLRSIFEQNARELNPDASAEETRKIGQFFAGAMMGILIPWVLSGMKNNALSNVSELSIPVFNREIMQKLLRGDDSIEMLGIVRSSRRFDVGSVYNIFLPLADEVVYKSLSSNKEIASTMATKVKTVEANIDKIMEAMDK